MRPCSMKYGIGQPVRRTEDYRRLTGEGCSGDDVDADRQAICELSAYDEESSRLIAGSLMDYCLPREGDRAIDNQI